MAIDELEVDRWLLKPLHSYLSENMTTEQIIAAWRVIGDDIVDLREAVNNRITELGYDNDDDDDECDNPEERDQLIELQYKLEQIDY